MNFIYRRPRAWARPFWKVSVEVIPLPAVPEIEAPEGPSGPALTQFLKRIEKAFGVPLPPGLGVPLERLEPLDAQGLTWATPECKAWLHLILSEPNPELLQLPLAEGMAFLGFFGHGLNSYAFYVFLRRPGRFIHLRLPYGGIYTDNVQAGHSIGRYLPALAAFLESAVQNSTLVVACEGMDDGYYRRHWPGTEKVEYVGSLLDSTDFTCLARSQ